MLTHKLCEPVFGGTEPDLEIIISHVCLLAIVEGKLILMSPIPVGGFNNEWVGSTTTYRMETDL